MAKRKQVSRLLWLALLLGLAFAGLGYRLIDLQVLRHQELSAEAYKNTHHEFLLEPRRGDILDAKGNLLATTVFVKAVCADPVLVAPHQAQVAAVLAPLLQLPEQPLAEALTPRLRQNAQGETVTNRYVVLKYKVPVETWESVRQAMAHLSLPPADQKLSPSERRALKEKAGALKEKAIFARDEQLRVYPNQSLAAHVLGFAMIEEKEVDDMPVSEITGRDGIELTLNGKLAGTRGWLQTETDRQGREVVPLREQDVEPCDGFNVVLTLDAFLQHIVETELADAMAKHSPLSISGIVVRPRTGEILAMATLPNFDPNHPGMNPEGQKNRAIADIAEPGSTFKIVVVSGALNEGVVRLTDTFDCEHGTFVYAGKILHDHEPYSVLSVENIITKSSNIGAAKIGIKMGENRLYDYICRFGFGAPTGLPLPGEVSAHRFVRPVSKWYKVSLAQIPMGQGISVTRMQMLMAVSALANNGCLMRPMLVDRLEDRGHNIVAKYYPQRVRQVISPAAAKLMVQALKTVATPAGTAPEAALDHYTVAGKTGTAQKAENGVYVHKYFSSFIGFFPADNPELCISVTLDEPKQAKGYYGGRVAAPIFKRIAEQAANYLNIRPEDGDGPPGPDNLAVPTEDHLLKTAAARPQSQ